MKKLVFMIVAFVAMSFAACGGQTNSSASIDSTATDTIDTIDVVDTIEVVDTIATDSVITVE